MTNLLEEDLNPRARQSSAINARKKGISSGIVQNGRRRRKSPPNPST